MRRPLDRDTEIARLRDRLERFGFPRLRMLLIVGATGACGFIASFLLLHAGLDSMPLRYAAAMTIAYAMFLLLLRAWIARPDSTNPDFRDIPGQSSPNHSASHASGSADMHDSGATGGIDWLDGLGAADEWALPLLLVVAIVTVLFASAWIVVSAPTLFAELLLDGVLSASLYRRLHRLERRHWLDTALRRTIWPFAATTLALVLFAFVAQHYVPGARSLGDVLHASAAKHEVHIPEITHGG
jgi:hypothetical protein